MATVRVDVQAVESGAPVALDEAGNPVLDAVVDAPAAVDQATIDAMKAEIESQLKAELATRQSFLAGGVVSQGLKPCRWHCIQGVNVRT